MTAVLEKLADQSVSIGSQSEILSAIIDTSTALAIWQRDLDDAVKEATSQLCQQSFELTHTFDPFSEKEGQIFTHKLATLTHAQLNPLVADTIDLCQRFVRFCGLKFVQIRIETVTNDGCRFFHLDNVAMRLVVTYAGSGTQWVSPLYASTARNQQTEYSGPLNSMQTGDVAIFKGKRSDAEDLILHRSPPLKSTMLPRLVVVVDSVDGT